MQVFQQPVHSLLEFTGFFAEFVGAGFEALTFGCVVGGFLA